MVQAVVMIVIAAMAVVITPAAVTVDPTAIAAETAEGIALAATEEGTATAVIEEAAVATRAETAEGMAEVTDQATIEMGGIEMVVMGKCLYLVFDHIKLPSRKTYSENPFYSMQYLGYINLSRVC